MTAKLTSLPTNCPVLHNAFETISAIATEAVWLPNQAKAITVAQAQTALRDLHHRLPRQQDLRVFEAPVAAYVSTLRCSLQDGDTPLCDTTRARLAQATELLELVRNQTRTVVDPADDRTGIRQNDEGRNIFCPNCDLGTACAGDPHPPVGQITDTEVDARLNALYREMVDSGQHNGGMSGVAWDRAVYRMAASQPAQAVDLGSPWVSVNDRLPSEEDYGESGDVVVRYRYNTPNSVQGEWDVGESRHDADDMEWNNGWLFGSCDYAEVSHWMPKNALLALIDSQAMGNG